VAHDLRLGQERLDAVADGDRPGPRPPAPVRLRERLVQVEVDDVEAHVAGPGASHHRVEVGPVVVERRARVVDDVGDLLDRRVEQPERVRVGQHQQRDVVARLGLEVLDVDAAAVVRADLDDLQAGHRHRRRVRPVRGVGREHLGPAVLAVRLVVGAGQQHPRELAVRAGARLERDVRQPGDLAERALELPHQAQRALRALRMLQRVQARVARQRGDALVQLRVVLHRARAERVEARVQVEVALGEAVVVADDLGLGDLGQLRRLGTAEAVRQQVLPVGDVELGRGERAPPGLRLLVDRAGAVALLGGLGEGHACTASRTADWSVAARRSMSALLRCSVMATSSPLPSSG
jgi:hypothetical protein